MDNVTLNDKMLRYIANEIEGFNPVLQRIRYFGHMINLVIQAFLFSAKTYSSNDLDSQHKAINLAIQEVSKLAKEANQDIRNKMEMA